MAPEKIKLPEKRELSGFVEEHSQKVYKTMLKKLGWWKMDLPMTLAKGGGRNWSAGEAAKAGKEGKVGKRGQSLQRGQSRQRGLSQQRGLSLQRGLSRQRGICAISDWPCSLPVNRGGPTGWLWEGRRPDPTMTSQARDDYLKAFEEYVEVKHRLRFLHTKG